MRAERTVHQTVAKLVRVSLAFHNLNKAAEAQIGLSLVQYHLLRTLRDMPACSPFQLARAAGMHPSTLTQSMKRMRRREFLFMSEDPRDSRKKILTLTRGGKRALDEFEKGIEALLIASEGQPLAQLTH